MSGSYGVPAASVAGSMDAQPLSAVVAAAQWFAVQTRYRFEKRVAAQLGYKSCEVYLPLLTENHTWSDRQKVVTIPLFPGYAFVHIDQSANARQAVLQTAGLIGFVSFGGIVAAVPRKQDLQLLLQEKGLFALHPFVHSGQRVRIRGGCLQGLEGVLVQHEEGKLVISIESIQRSLAIEIKGYELELV
ncbi:MAG: transcription termination/antitermination NusG family protein [Candidatus Sulfotelmatobacter sp.]